MTSEIYVKCRLFMPQIIANFWHVQYTTAWIGVKPNFHISARVWGKIQHKTARMQGKTQHIAAWITGKTHQNHCLEMR